MTPLSIPVGDADHSLGPRTAAVTLVEYGDYQCSYCAEAYRDLKAVRAAMGDELLFVFRNFPLAEIHPHAVRAAEFAEMAATAGLFWQAHGMLYENQRALTDADLRRYGAVLEIDPATVAQAFDGRFDERIRQDFSGGVRSGVNGTPTLFIDGQRYDGPRDAGNLTAVLRAAAKATRP